MPAAFGTESLSLGLLRSFAERGDKVAEAIVAIMNGTQWVSMTAAAEGAPVANTIRITGQIKDQDGQDVAGVKSVLVKSKPPSGAGTITVVAAGGTAKAGSGTTELWLETTSAGAFQIDVLNAAVEDNLIIATVDNGESELLKLTFA